MNRMLISNLHSTRLHSAHGQHTFSLKFDSLGQNYVSEILMQKKGFEGKTVCTAQGPRLAVVGDPFCKRQRRWTFLSKPILKRWDAFENKNWHDFDWFEWENYKNIWGAYALSHISVAPFEAAPLTQRRYATPGTRHRLSKSVAPLNIFMYLFLHKTFDGKLMTKGY